MRNVTITLEDELARWARILAAERDTSLSGLIADLLRERMTQQQDYERSRQKFLSIAPRALKRPGARYPRRENLHERRDLRRHQRPRLRP